MTRSLLGSLLALLLSVGSAQAAPFTFFGQDAGGLAFDIARLPATPNADNARNQFLGNAAPGAGVQNFDGAAFSPASFGFPPTAITGGLSAGGGPVTYPVTDGFGGYAISGNGLWQAESTGFVLTLSVPVTAIGFYGIDIGDAGGTLTVALNNGAPLIPVPHTVTPNGENSGNVLFFGVTDLGNPFDVVTFRHSLATDRFNFDDFTVGFAKGEANLAPTPESANLAPTPEPGTLLLLGTSLAGMAGAAWKRRKAARRQPGLTSSAT